MIGKVTTWLALSLAACGAFASHTGNHRKGSHSSSGRYTVRNGDNDWAIAHRFHITERQLHALNPNVTWSSLQPGVKLSLPASSAPKEARSPSRRLAHGSYVVREGDNDWTIAAKLGIANKALRALNPDVRWTRIQPGQRLVVPGAVAAAASSRRIATRYAVVSADSATLRSGASTRSTAITTVDKGSRARVVDRDGVWYKLRFPKGTLAWVRGDLLSPVRGHSEAYASTAGRRGSRRYAVRYRRHGRTPETPVAMSEIGGSGLIRTAYDYRGTRYRTGGTSRSSGFDCSGFAQRVFRKNGVALPRTSHEQSGVGKLVGRQGLKKGDLVFFRTNRSQRINHVGIYIGEGKFIHASSGGGRVQVNSLSEGYYAQRFACGRRVIKSAAKKAPAHKAKAAK